MPTNAEQVAALERRMAAATSVDSVSVDKTLLAELVQSWRNWQMVEALPRFQALKHDYCWGKDRWAVRNNHMGDSGPWLPTPADALQNAALNEE